MSKKYVYFFDSETIGERGPRKFVLSGIHKSDRMITSSDELTELKKTVKEIITEIYPDFPMPNDNGKVHIKYLSFLHEVEE